MLWFVVAKGAPTRSFNYTISECFSAIDLLCCLYQEVMVVAIEMQTLKEQNTKKKK